MKVSQEHKIYVEEKVSTVIYICKSLLLITFTHLFEVVELQPMSQIHEMDEEPRAIHTPFFFFFFLKGK